MTLQSFSTRFLKFYSLAAVILGMACIDAPSAHASLLTNGDFSSGLTGWTPYTTSNGTIGSPAVINFDVTGLGSNPAAQLEVGEVDFTNVQSGGGLSQIFTGPAGDYSLSFDFASENQFLLSGNASGGLFSLILDDTILNSFDTDFISAGATERGSLSGFLAGVAAGTHEIKIQATRPFITGDTPFQYFDNVVVSASNTSAPVPGPLPLLGVGAAFGLSRNLRKRIKASGIPVSSTHTP